MRLASPLNANRRLIGLCLAALFSATALAQLPDGLGKAETERICKQCHELEQSIAPRQDRAGWEDTVSKMVTLGAQGTPKDFQAIIDYLAEHYPAEGIPKINVNKARAIELESGLSLPRSQAAKVVEYREKNGPFKSLEDLKKVPGVDFAKFEAKKDRLTF
jgi:competence protein ComEA